MGNLAQDQELLQLFDTFQQTRQKLVERLRTHGGPVTAPYVFTEGERSDVSLDDLFGDRRDLLVIHNMGRHCRWCTLWADGLNGLLDHLQARTAVVLMNGDDPQVQKEFATGRHWRFRMIQDPDATFTTDLHFAQEQDGQRYLMPGVSAFHRNEDGSIVHVSSDYFGPGDIYMPVYPLFDLLQDGPADWEPQYSYQRPTSIDLPTNGA